MDIFRIVIAISIYLMLPILYFVLRNYTKPKKNLVLGVTLPYAVRDCEAVRAVCQRFKRNLNLMFLALTLLCAAGLFLPYQSVMFTYEMLWFIFAAAVPFLIYAKAYNALKRLKAVNGWGSESAQLAAPPQLKPKLMKKAGFILPVLVSLVPCVRALFLNGAERWVLFSVGAAFVLTDALLYAVCVITARRPTVDGNSDLARAAAEIRRSSRGKCFLFISWATALYALAFMLLYRSLVPLLSITAVYTVLVLSVCLRAEFGARRAQEELTAGSGAFADDDAHWLWGLFYCNKEDARNIVDSRVGMGTTVNMAKPLGKIIVGFSALCIAALPFVGVWMMNEEFMPVRIEFDGASVTAYHTGAQFQIPLEEVREAAVLDRLPRASRVVGTAMEGLLKGRFNVDGYGPCRLCLDPGSGEFLVLSTQKDTYIVSGPGEQLRWVEQAVSARAKQAW